MQETRTGRVRAFGKKKRSDVWESFCTGRAGGGAIGAERLFSCHTASVRVSGFKPQVNCFPLKESHRENDNNTATTKVLLRCLSPAAEFGPQDTEEVDHVTQDARTQLPAFNFMKGPNGTL